MMRGCVMHKSYDSKIFTFWVMPLLSKFHSNSVSGPYLLYYWSNGFETSHVDLSWWEGVSCTRVMTLKFLLFELCPFYQNFHSNSVSGPYLLYYWSNGFETSHIDLSWREGVSCTRVMTLNFYFLSYSPFVIIFIVILCPDHISYITYPIDLKLHMLIYHDERVCHAQELWL